MAVLFGGVPAENVTVYNTSCAEMVSPRLNATGYVNMTLLSPDGGQALAIDGMFYTDDCPYEGARCQRLPVVWSGRAHGSAAQVGGAAGSSAGRAHRAACVRAATASGRCRAGTASVLVWMCC
jgi:hypothetical protein